MQKTNAFVDIVEQMINNGLKKEIGHLYTEDPYFTGNTIQLKGKSIVNFGSCSYFGLEFDQRLKEGAKQAVDCYGTQFSESRTYVSIKLYQTLELLLNQLFEAYCVVTPTTTLGHISAIPVLVGPNDAIIMDHQVHNSVQMAVSMLRGKSVHIELLRHNRIDLLEQRVVALKQKHHKIWYMADAIYSMYGDQSPVDEIYALMDNYRELQYYVDDAHGMSVFGQNGRGSVLNNRLFHPQMVLAISLNKAFAAGGGAIMFPNATMAHKVRSCGGAMITSGPMQPSALGAAVACAGIHLTEEIYIMQEELQEKIKYAQLQIKKYNLPVISCSGTPIFFIGVSLPKVGYNMIQRMMDRGYYLNIGGFPAVPMKNTGIRFTITRLHTFTQIENMVAAMAQELPKALEDESVTMEEIYKAFKMQQPQVKTINRVEDPVVKQSLSLQMNHYKSIDEIDKTIWDNLFLNKGSFDWSGIKLLENSFCHNKLQENNWLFDYVIIKNNEGEIVLATMLTTSLWKDDMLAPAEISSQIEEKRQNGAPYYLVSKVISTGSLITEGEHLYIDKTSSLWKDAMKLLFDKLYVLQELYEADSISLRDFLHTDSSIDDFMVENGFLRVAMPETNIVEKITWNTKEEFIRGLSDRSKDNYRLHVRRYETQFLVAVAENPSIEEIEHWYQLYINVKENSLHLNTFLLPKKLFRNLSISTQWEILTLKLKHKDTQPTVAVIFCYKTPDVYIPMIIGMDYTHNKQYKTYRQALYRIALRAAELGKKKIHLGFSASIEKRKIGATAVPVYVYIQNKDTFQLQVVDGLVNNISSLNTPHLVSAQ